MIEMRETDMNQLNTDFRFELDSNVSSYDKRTDTVYQIMHGAFKKIYMDQYKNCWECPSYPNGRGCSVTSKKFLDNNFLEKRKTFICIFRVVEFPKD